MTRSAEACHESLLHGQCSGSFPNDPACDHCPLSFQVCTCIALDHPHGKGQCDEPPVVRGGICNSCRAWNRNR